MYVRAKVEEVRVLSGSVKGFALNVERELGAAPGQFVMVWVPGVGEIPISVAWEDGKRALLVVARKGRVTGYLHEHAGPGSTLYLRGPLGRGFNVLGGRALVVGGGYGAAPLLYLCRALRGKGARLTVVLGFKSAENAILLDEFRNLAGELYVATEDGSLGVQATAAGLALELLPFGEFEFVYTCGKEQMMKRVVDASLLRGVKAQASLERLLKCGIGVCGSCALEPLGMRVCADGPVFDGETLSRLEDFGRWWRNAAGRRVSLPD